MACPLASCCNTSNKGENYKAQNFVLTNAKSFRALKSVVSPLLPDRGPGQRRLLVTGHSVGAGLASIFVQQLYSQCATMCSTI